MALTEIKLSGKLDLSMWRSDFDDDDDKDSSIDLSPTPFSVLPPNNNLISGSASTGKSPQHQEEASTTFAEFANFPHPSPPFPRIQGVQPKSSHNQAEEGDLSTKGLQLHLSQSHNQGDEGGHETEDIKALRDSGESGTKEQSKGGAKRVEFLQETNSMAQEPKASSTSFGTLGILREKTQKGHSTKKIRSGSLLSEIRKMSLASQDAEEEKKKQASSATPGPSKRIRRIKRRKREEEYTDKDRAAAVTLGSRDIKQSLKAKKKRERKMRLSLDFMNSEEYLASMLVVEALYQMRVRKTPQAALSTLNKALELQPTHKGALVARSQCHIRLGDASSALKDAETSFGQNETYILGLYQYAEALYQLGEFEKALIAFHQGYRLRKDMEGFRIGVQKSQEAIRRAIGDRTATKMNNLDEILSIIEELQEVKKRTGGNTKDEDLLMGILRKRFGEKAIALVKSKSKPKNQWITREVLGQMYSDKEYLAKFIHRPDVLQQTGSAEALRETAKEGLRYLENREKFWRQQNPLYSRKTMTSMINNNSLLAKLTTTPSPSANGKVVSTSSKGGVEKGNDRKSSTSSLPLNVKNSTMISRNK